LAASQLLPAVSFEPGVAATVGAVRLKSLAHPGHQVRPGNPGDV